MNISAVRDGLSTHASGCAKTRRYRQKLTYKMRKKRQKSKKKTKNSSYSALTSVLRISIVYFINVSSVRYCYKYGYITMICSVKASSKMQFMV